MTADYIISIAAMRKIKKNYTKKQKQNKTKWSQTIHIYKSNLEPTDNV